MLRFAAVIGCALALAGCGAGTQGLSQVPQQSGTSRADYQVLAACAARKLDATGVSKSDMLSERLIRLSLDSGGVRYWEVMFRARADRGTDWTASTPNTMWGAFRGPTDEVVAAITGCEAGVG